MDITFEDIGNINNLDDLINLGIKYSNIDKIRSNNFTEELNKYINENDQDRNTSIINFFVERGYTLVKDTKQDNINQIYKFVKNNQDNIYKLDDKYYSINLEKVVKLVNPLTKLKEMIGLERVKQDIVDMILYYLQNFEVENNSMLHTIIEGPPGVGKTELGKIIGEIYLCLGVLSSDKFKSVKRSDLIGQHLGHTAIKTQQVIDDANGGVLFIDEAYSLGSSGSNTDSFSKECIDTLNLNLSENKKKFICIIAGYSEELEKNFFAHNIGLKRRFLFKFTIDGYSNMEMVDILKKKIRELDINNKWILNIDNKYLDGFFEKNKMMFNNYGGDIENLLTNIKFAHSRRTITEPKSKKIINEQDFDKGYLNYIRNKNIKKQDSLTYFI